MKTYSVNFTGVKTYWDFYEALIKGLDFPDWCGKTPDAIWDMLTRCADEPTIVRIQGMNRLPKSLSDEVECFKKIIADLPVMAPYADYQFVFYD